MAVDADDAFQKELIDLFVQEAHEWLQQIHVALDELQQGPAPDRHIKLAQTIKAGLANLGGSAATINLSDVERASFSALPFVEAVQDPAAALSPNDFLALCRQLGHIHTALTRATGVTFAAEGAAADTVPVTIPAENLLAALQRLQERQAGAGSSRRNLVQTVIAQVEGLIRSGVGQCDVSSMRDFLERYGRAEQAFLESVQQQLPAIVEGIAQLKAGAVNGNLPHERYQPLIEAVAHLWSAAQQVSASQAMTFFMGLHSFLTMALERRIDIAAKKYDAVEARLREVVEIIQAWVENGRTERSEIDAVLPNPA
jgi:chemotaxis protein histidine kinase CheA